LAFEEGLSTRRMVKYVVVASGEALLLLPHCESDGLELAGERELTRADVVPMQRVQRVRHSGASVGHRSEHLADITWDAHVRATAGAECRKRIP
jgi:hypothetical protein